MAKKISRRQFLKRGALAYGALALGKIPKAASAKRQPAKAPAVEASQWPEIFRVYPNWQRERKIPRFARDAEAAIALVTNVATVTGTRPADVLAVKAKYTISRYALPRYAGKISQSELKIFNALLSESISNKPAFDYLSSATRPWFTKKKVLALAGSK